MRNTYSLYDAKAKLSAIIRRVREGHSAVITHRGEPVAEIRPVAAGKGSLEGRFADLEASGIIMRPSSSSGPVPRVAKRSGSVQRFLADRD